ncbi:MAG TPA: hypothetical protein VH083_01955, partial [Myxococcales bacterium]|nr:hypothetical protein [Myxococcales bacterium]
AGADPRALIEARAQYTIFGGLIAVFLYVAWPTRGERQAGEAAATLLEAYRRYFELITNRYRGLQVSEEEIDKVRLATRTARSNAELAVDALEGEPSAAGRRALYSALGAASNRFVHAVMMLNASDDEPLRDEDFALFCAEVNRTLLLLIRAMRGENVNANEFPDLREIYERLVKSSGETRALLLSELDRMTNSVNTLSERVAILRRAGT